jgi:uncharacterized phage protein (TIGR02218 family)
MRTLSASLQAMLASEVTTLATCWKLTLKNGQQFHFTDHDRDLTQEGVTYQAKSGFTAGNLSSSSGLAVDSMEIEGLLESDAITEAALLAGAFDHAEIEVFLVNYTQPDAGRLIVRRGHLGEITLRQQTFVAEVRGLTQALNQQLGQFYSPLCRAQLGDSRCGVNLAAHTVTGTVESLLETPGFTDSARTEAEGTFTFGTVTFTSGANAGKECEVKRYTRQTGVGQVELFLPLPYPLAVGDGYTLRAGCDKTLQTCRARFNNAVNFRGEPHIPGLDRMLETASTRSNRA